MDWSTIAYIFLAVWFLGVVLFAERSFKWKEESKRKLLLHLWMSVPAFLFWGIPTIYITVFYPEYMHPLSALILWPMTILFLVGILNTIYKLFKTKKK